MSVQNLFQEKKIHSVSDITRNIKKLIEDHFSSVWVKGEISNLRGYPSGHFYFIIKDEHSTMNVVMFKGYKEKIKFDLEDGMSVILHGRISIYEARGQYQMIVDHAAPDGIGALQLAFEQLKNKLKAEGLFDENNKKTLPLLPQTIGIVTSLQGAVIHDMKNILKRRFENIDIIIYPVRVQGEGAAKEIVEGIDYFSHEKNVDIVIVGRGGGSLEDLWAFNEEIVARSIAACTIPIVSAVGHETDFCISDFVADLRAPTPSAAAELCVPMKENLSSQISSFQNRIYTAVQHKLLSQKKELSFLMKSIPTPQMVLDQLHFRLNDMENQMLKSIQERIKDRQHQLSNSQLKINLLSPKNILKRGYIIGKDVSGKIVKHKQDLHEGDEIQLIFYDGEIKAVIAG